MALFQILRGKAANLANKAFHDGYAYLTPDDGAFYIDAETDGVQKRIRINPEPDLQEMDEEYVQDMWNKYFPLIPRNMTLGDTFAFGKYQVASEDPWPIEWKIVHQTDEYQIAQTSQIIDILCFDARESSNPDSGRVKHGNNKWGVSNIAQFLNSDQESWYSAQHSYDAPPSGGNTEEFTYDTHKGFLYYFNDAEKSLLREMSLTFANPAVDGGGSYTWTGKVWLPTVTQIANSQNNKIDEGSLFAGYAQYADPVIKIKKLHLRCARPEYGWNAGDGFDYLLSSADTSRSEDVWTVTGDGNLNSDSPDSMYSGIAPCICLPRNA